MINCNYKLLPDKFYLAVSAGVDSVAIAHFLAKKNKDFTIFHFNHKLIPEDDLMENKIAKLSNLINRPLKVVVNDQSLSVAEDGIEAACRKVRFNAYKELDAPIVVCHHLDDCIESYFMNWLRGHDNFIPIPPVTVLPNNYITRPFLLSTKFSFSRWADLNDLHDYIVHDPMNDDISRMRNWTRHVVLPVINDRYKGLSKVVRKKILKAYNQVTIPEKISLNCKGK